MLFFLLNFMCGRKRSAAHSYYVDYCHVYVELKGNFLSLFVSFCQAPLSSARGVLCSVSHAKEWTHAKYLEIKSALKNSIHF